VKKSTDTLHVILKESPPRLGWRFPAAADHVFADTGFTDLDSDFEQFTMDFRSAPDRIVTAHGADQFSNSLRHRRTSRLATSNLPGPEQAKALPMPSDDSGAFCDVDAKPSICHAEQSQAQAVGPQL
jgi:hypothetical protein